MDLQNTENSNKKYVMEPNTQQESNTQLVSFNVAFPYHISQAAPYNPIECFEDQNINPQQSLPVRANLSDTSRSILMEQNTFRDVQSHENENVLQAYDMTSNQQEINNDMKFLSHSDLIDLNLNELNNLLTGSDQNYVPTEKEYFLEAYNLECNTNQPTPIYFNNQSMNNFNHDSFDADIEVLLTKQQKEVQGKTININPTKNQTYFVPRIDRPHDDSLMSCSSILNDNYDVMPMMSSTIKSPEKNYLLIPVNEDIENSTMLQNCKSIDLNTEVLNKIDSASAGRSGVLLPLQMDTSNDSTSPNIKRKTPIRVVRSFTTNRIMTSKKKPETLTSSGINETTNITVHQTINIYEDAGEYSIKNTSSRTRKRKQTFETVKHSDESLFHGDMETTAIKRPVKEEELTSAPLINTTLKLSQQQPLSDIATATGSLIKDENKEDKVPIIKAITKKKMPLIKKKTEICPKCNQVFKKLSIHIIRCKFDPSLFVLKEDTNKATKETSGSFICDVCLKTFRNEKILSSHKLGHSQIRCKFCTKVHSSEKDLKKHLETCEIKTKKRDSK